MFSRPKKPKPPEARDSSAGDLKERKLRMPTQALDDGYESDEDAPRNYFESHMRSRARAALPDAKMRRAVFERSVAWGHPAGDAHLPPFFAADPGLQFSQEGPYCFAFCAAFASLRRRGYSPQEAIAQCRSPALAGAVKNKWMPSYLLMNRSWDSTPTWLALLMSAVENEVHQFLHKGPKQRVGGLDRSAKAPIVYPHLIGVVPEGRLATAFKEGQFRVELTMLGNRIVNVSRYPSTRQARRLQEALFGELQETRAVKVPLPAATPTAVKTAPPPLRAVRRSEPLILIGMYFPQPHGEIVGHVVLLDLFDENSFGIFDPNFGWLTHKKGKEILNLEMILQAIWGYYSSGGAARTAYGYRSTLSDMEKSEGAQMFAMQLFTQELL